MLLLMKRISYILCLIFLFSACVCIADYFFYVYSCRFCASNLYPPLGWADLSRCEESALDLSVFAQKYRYTGEGRQCFALESEDGRYVVKFFKKCHLNKKKWAKNKGLLRHVYCNKNNKSEVWSSQLFQTARCFQLAIDNLPEETGLLYSHFHKTSFFHETLKVKGVFGFQEINLNETSFVVQQKAEMVIDRLSKCLSRKDIKAAVDSLVDIRRLLISRTRKGFTDDRQYYQVNYGFVNNKAVQLDVGKLYASPISGLDSSVEIDRLTNNLKKWVKKNYSSLYEEFELSLSHEDNSLSNDV